MAHLSVIRRRPRKSKNERAAINRVSRTHKSCPAIESIGKVGNELRLAVVSSLMQGPLRFNELNEMVTGLDPKSLSRVLKFLGTEGIIHRSVLSTQPFAVQYSLTEKGRGLEPVVEALRAWGEKWVIPQEILPNSPVRLSH